MYCLSKYLDIYTYGQSGGRWYWSIIAGAPGDADWETLEIHLEAVIVRTGRCTWRPRLSEFADALAARDCVNLEAVFGRVWRSTWRIWLNERRDALGGRNRTSLEMHVGSIWSRSIGGMLGAATLSISWLTRNSRNETRWLYFWALMESWLVAVDLEGRLAGSWSYIEGSTHNRENEGKTDNGVWIE